MPSDAIVRARVSASIKNQAGAILAESGLTISAAIRMMLIRTVAERALPFELAPKPKPRKARAVRLAEHDGGDDELAGDYGIVPDGDDTLPAVMAEPVIVVMPVW
jgi:addiction module RelB/DinJ family antitoxin